MISAGPKPSTIVRAWDIDLGLYPNLTEQEWLERIKKDRNGVQQFFEKENKVLDDGQKTLAALLAGQLAAWQDGKWYDQAVGCSATTALASDTKLGQEIFRKPFTELLLNGKIVNTNTFFTGADFSGAATTVTTATTPATTDFSVASVTGLAVGDLIRVALTTGYEYKQIGAIAGNKITLATAVGGDSTTGPLSAAPANGATVDQVIEEAGIFGNKSAGYAAGSVTATNGSAVITGNSTAWVGQVVAGDLMIIDAETNANRKYYTIQSVDSNTQITLTSAYTGTTGSGKVYGFKGTAFNRVTGLRYIKLPSRGFVIENQWTMGG